MRFQRIHEAVNFQPWFISSQGYASIRALFEKVMTRPAGAKEDWDEMLADFVRARPDMSFDRATGTATIHVLGVLGPHLSNVEKSCGNTSYEDITKEIAEAKLLGATRINFIFDSPGGACMGCHEAAEAIAELKNNSTIITVAFTEGLMCSAAYYLASGCSAIVATKSAIVGNIGVILPWVDSSGAWEMMGLDFQPITSDGADLKSAMHGPSLSEGQREFLQEGVNRLGEMFREHVKLGRLHLADEVFRAGWYGGTEAQTLGLIDEVGDSVDAL
jgi:protease-4